VSATGTDGVTHSVEVHGATLFQAAASALAAFRAESWAADALTPSTTLRVEVHTPATVHDVPIKVVDRWLESSSASPQEFASKRRGGGNVKRRHPVHFCAHPTWSDAPGSGARCALGSRVVSFIDQFAVPEIRSSSALRAGPCLCTDAAWGGCSESG
jgi:hypothetical protein